MNQNMKHTYELRAKAAVEAFKNNRFDAYYVPDCAAAVELVRSMLPKGAAIASGGSVSLEESGIMALLKGGDYNYIDRGTSVNSEDYIKASFTCDAFFMSSNAVVESGKLYNIDGAGNRVAALTFGPKNVYVIAGVNKLVPDIETAQKRLEREACPANAIRLNKKTPCAATGSCADCHSPDRICCSTVITTYQRTPGRVKVIIVGEGIGY